MARDAIFQSPDLRDGYGAFDSATASSLQSMVSNLTSTEEPGSVTPTYFSPESSTAAAQESQKRRILGDKNRNLKMPVAAEDHQDRSLSVVIARKPVQVRSVHDGTQTHRGEVSDKAAGPSMEISSAENLNRKISDLMRQRAAHKVEPANRYAVYGGGIAFPSSLSRGRKMFSDATKAVKDKVNKVKENRKFSQRLNSPGQLSFATDYDSMWSESTDDGNPIGQLGRRIAEGKNLCNPKIQHMLGDGNIPSKPLHVYESMRSRHTTDDSADDSSTEEGQKNLPLSGSDLSGFDFGFQEQSPTTEAPERSTTTEFGESGIKENTTYISSAPTSADDFSTAASSQRQQSTSMGCVVSAPESLQTARAASSDMESFHETTAVRNQTYGLIADDTHYLPPSPPTHRFSNMVSGLHQHPNVMEFAGSPRVTNTQPALPVTVKRQSIASLDRKLGTPISLPSATVGSSAKATEDNQSSSSCVVSKMAQSVSPGIRKKSASEDLGAQWARKKGKSQSRRLNIDRPERSLLQKRMPNQVTEANFQKSKNRDIPNSAAVPPEIQGVASYQNDDKKEPLQYGTKAQNTHSSSESHLCTPTERKPGFLSRRNAQIMKRRLSIVDGKLVFSGKAEADKTVNEA